MKFAPDGSRGSGVTLVQVRADGSVCPRGSGHRSRAMRSAPYVMYL